MATIHHNGSLYILTFTRIGSELRSVPRAFNTLCAACFFAEGEGLEIRLTDAAKRVAGAL